MAASRQLIWKLLLIVILMTAAELALFSGVNTGYEVNFGDELQLAHLPKLFALAVAVMALFIVLQGGQFGAGKTGYTLRRLPMGEWSITILWALIYLASFVVIWAVQLTLVFVCWRLYCGVNAMPAPDLELFVEFYAEPFLHSLLPLADVTRWLRMIFWLPSLSFSLAAFGFCHRRGKFRLEPLVLLAVGLGMMSSQMGSTGVDVALMILSVVLAGSSAYGMWRIAYEED